MQKRHCIAIPTGLLLICGALFFYPQLEHELSQLSKRFYACKTLHQWQLPATRNNIDLFLSAQHNHHSCTTRSFQLDSTVPPLKNPFTKEYTYANLFDDNVCRIGVCTDQKTIKSLQPLVSALSAETNHRIILDLMTTKKDFINALNTYDIVLYFGHANLGRGIFFDNDPAGGFFRMGPEFIDIPTCYLRTNDVIMNTYSNGFCSIKGGSKDLQSISINSKVFAYLGCRTDGYYRKVWKQNASACCFIGTTYTCDTTSTAAEFVQTLISGILHGRTLNEIIDILNRGKAKDILFGRVEETQKYNNPTNHSSVLFTVDPM